MRPTGWANISACRRWSNDAPDGFLAARRHRGAERGAAHSVELTQAHLDGIAALNPRLNAYLTVTGEQALEQAKASDARRAEGMAGPLDGIPLAIKDLFCTTGILTTAGEPYPRRFHAAL